MISFFSCFKSYRNLWIKFVLEICVLTRTDLCIDKNICRTSLVARTVNNLPVMQETWVQFPGQEDPLEKEMATHSSILSWRIPWTKEPGGLQFTRSQRVGHNWSDLAYMHTCGLRQSRGLHGLQPEPQPPPHPLPRRPSACASAHARTDRCAQTGHLSCSLIPWVYLCLGVGLLNKGWDGWMASPTPGVYSNSWKVEVAYGSAVRLPGIDTPTV